MDRRQFLAAGAAAATAGLAGCRAFFRTRSSRVPPLVEDRPDAVYYPTHVEGMQLVDVRTAGDFRVALTYSFPHRFWLVNGNRTEKVGVDDGDTLHMMATVWDPETGTVIPKGGLFASVTRDGETVVGRRQLWPMLSQNMGVHAGDNVGLDGDGTYEVQLSTGPLSARTSGAFAGRFDERASLSFSLAFSGSTLEETSYRRLSDREGQRGAVDPMDMEMVPVSGVPAVDDLPGTVLGEPTGGDGVFATTHLDAAPEGVERESDGRTGPGDGHYLAVSARTPYNDFPLPMLSLAATITREAETVFDGSLVATLDPDLGYHYGAAVPRLESGDRIALSVETPPQVARHEGYETAFFEFPEMTVEV